MDKNSFYNLIYDYYFKSSAGNVPLQHIKYVSEIITDYYYKQYMLFRNKYPKSKKRYSNFQLKDLIHPNTYELIIKYFNENEKTYSLEYAGILLDRNESDLKKFINDRQNFYDMF